MTTLASIQSLSKHFNGVIALSDFSCTIEEGEILGLLGPNGAGKTTLFDVITGLLKPDMGAVEFKGQMLNSCPINKIANMGIGRTFQTLRLIRRITVLENILLCFKEQPGENLTDLFFRPGRCRWHETANHAKACELLETVGLLVKANDLADNLSYGQQKILSLVCCMATGADLLLLDEPVAGIAPEMTERILTIIAELPKYGKTAVVIEHNIDAIKDVVHRMIFMDAGRKVCEGTPGDVLNDSRVIEAYLD